MLWSHLGKERGSGNEGKVLDIRLWTGLVGSEYLISCLEGRFWLCILLVRRPIRLFAMLLAAFLSALSPACLQQSERRQQRASICSIQRPHEICEPAVLQAHVIHLFFKAVMIHSFLWMTNYRAHLKNPLLRENFLPLPSPHRCLQSLLCMMDKGKNDLHWIAVKRKKMMKTVELNVWLHYWVLRYYTLCIHSSKLGKAIHIHTSVSIYMYISVGSTELGENCWYLPKK